MKGKKTKRRTEEQKKRRKEEQKNRRTEEHNMFYNMCYLCGVWEMVGVRRWCVLCLEGERKGNLEGRREEESQRGRKERRKEGQTNGREGG